MGDQPKMAAGGSVALISISNSTFFYFSRVFGIIREIRVLVYSLRIKCYKSILTFKNNFAYLSLGPRDRNIINKII